MKRLLFIGDIVGDAGLEFVEAHLPELKRSYEPTFIVANAENLSAPTGNFGIGMTLENTSRLFDLGIDVLTGGNHSWDNWPTSEVFENPRILRPFNYGSTAPGKGVSIIERGDTRLGVVNLVSRTALPQADQPYDALNALLGQWEGKVDTVLVDFHGESVTEKLTFAWAFAGRVTAVLGTHTHVMTLDDQILPGGTAYVTDVGMTGPTSGMQGYKPDVFVQMMQTRLPVQCPTEVAEGPVQLGAVVVDFEGLNALQVNRLLK